MLAWKEGEFVIEYDITTEKRSIDGDVMYHVFEGLRRLDEAADPVVDSSPVPSEAIERQRIDETRDPAVVSDPAPGEPIERRAARPMFALIPMVAVLVGGVAWWSAAPTRGLTDAATLPAVAEEVSATDTPASMGEARFPSPASGPAARSTRKATHTPASKRERPKQRIRGPAKTSPEPTVKTSEEEAEAPPADSLDFTPAPVADVLNARPLEIVEPAAAPQEAWLGVVVRSKLDAGTISVIIDGQPVYSAPLKRTAGAVRRFFQGRDDTDEDRFNTRLPLSPGAHRLAARIQLEDGSEVQTADITVEGESGVARELSIVAGAKRTQPIAVELK
jgi:hypothetical protein